MPGPKVSTFVFVVSSSSACFRSGAAGRHAHALYYLFRGTQEDLALVILDPEDQQYVHKLILLFN